MQYTNIQALDSSANTIGQWLDISQYSAWSLHATALESGGSISVLVSNNPIWSPPVSNDPTAFVLATMSPASNHSAFYVGGTVANWLAVVKVPGSSPTETFVRLFASIG